jgi:GNAT-family acetyltransferase (TIGR03103 family)
MQKQLRTIDPLKSPSLKNWGDLPKQTIYEKMQNNSYIDCGWGRLIFAHTFQENADVASLLRDERSGARDIAFYIRDPQFTIHDAPHEFFLDPSHTYRFFLEENLPKAAKQDNFTIRAADLEKDLGAINAIYMSREMVTITPEVIEKESYGKKIVFYVAEDNKSGQIVGTVMGADHKEIFNDPENGCSLWSLAADPKALYSGIGTALVIHLLKVYKEKGREFMDLSVINDSYAINLYKRMGFSQVPVFCLKRKNAINERLYTYNTSDAGLNPYALIIINEARRRGIGVKIIDAANNYFSLFYGSRSVVCRESLTELTTAIAMSRCADKSITHNLLKEIDVHLPDQHVVCGDVSDFEFLKKHKHIAVKPADGEQGQGISLLVRSPDELELAVKRAKKVSSKVVLEEFVQGHDLRIVVIDFKVVAAAIRKPAEVMGDGEHTIKELIKKQSKRRELATHGESSIPMDKETENCIHAAGYALNDILPQKKHLQVRKTANLHTGGTIHDVTDALNQRLAEAAIEIAKTIDIPVVGIDFMVASPKSEEYVFIEANERPGLANHDPQPIAEKFIDLLFPNTIVSGHKQ